MRKLDLDELAWIGGLTIMVLIIGTPYVVMVELSQPYMDEWEESILSESECIDNLVECLIWLSVDIGRFGSIIIFLKPIYKFGDWLGMPKMPKRWEIFLKSKPRGKSD